MLPIQDGPFLSQSDDGESHRENHWDSGQRLGGVMDWLKLAGALLDKLVEPLKRGADALESLAKFAKKLEADYDREQAARGE